MSGRLPSPAAVKGPKTRLHPTTSRLPLGLQAGSGSRNVAVGERVASVTSRRGRPGHPTGGDEPLLDGGGPPPTPPAARCGLSRWERVRPPCRSPGLGPLDPGQHGPACGARLASGSEHGGDLRDADGVVGEVPRGRGPVGPRPAWVAHSAARRSAPRRIGSQAWALPWQAIRRACSPFHSSSYSSSVRGAFLAVVFLGMCIPYVCTSRSASD